VVALDGSINVASVGNGEADDALEDLSDLEHSSTSQEEQELFVEQAWADKDPPQTQAQHDHPPPPPPPPCTETPQKPQKQQQQQFQQVSNEASLDIFNDDDKIFSAFSSALTKREKEVAQKRAEQAQTNAAAGAASTGAEANGTNGALENSRSTEKGGDDA